MHVKSRHAWTSAASLGALVAMLALVPLVPASAAGNDGTTYTITTVKARGSVWIAGGGKPMRAGRLNAGNRLFETNEVRRDDGAKGLFVATAMIVSPGSVPAHRAVGLMHGVYRFGDGEIFVDGFVSFAAPSATGVIVGGTGAYRGARGIFRATESKEVLHLLP